MDIILRCVITAGLLFFLITMLLYGEFEVDKNRLSRAELSKLRKKENGKHTVRDTVSRWFSTIRNFVSKKVHRTK